MRDHVFRPRYLVALPTSIALAAGLAAVPMASAVDAPQGSIDPEMIEGSVDLVNPDRPVLPDEVPDGVSDYIKPGEPTLKTPIRTEVRQIANLPEGVSIDRIEWLSSRRVALFIHSAAMPNSTMQVQILLARDWYSQPDRKFPEVWALDGMRARDDENGWTIETNIEDFYADKNVNVILPVGGESSFYSDWLEEDNGRNYKWESFLINELVPILDNGFRGNGKRAITGISMGATAAVNLAAHNPGLFSFVGAFSGYLDTTTPGMPEAITAAQLDAGRYHSQNMWGRFGSQQWKDNDPKLNVSKLKGTKLYVSAGSGREADGQVTVPNQTALLSGMGLEAISRMTTQTFVNYAHRADVDVIARFRDAGIHSWYYWQFEMAQAWPTIADALGVEGGDRGSDCAPIGAIADATNNGIIGTCINNEYDVAGGRGKAEDFRRGTAYWSPETGAHALFGRIGAHYSNLGGPSSWLGFPRSSEMVLPDGNGRYVEFENGAIYWTNETGAHAVPRDIMNAWGEIGYENGDIGYPISDPVERNGGVIQQFQRGFVVRNGDKTFWVRGEIAKRYAALDTVSSPLGKPTSNEIPVRGGMFQQYEHGNIYWSPDSGAHMIAYGGIFDAWGKHQWEQGEFGWPTSDQTTVPAGGDTITFQHGTISQINGEIKEERS